MARLRQIYPKTSSLLDPTSSMSTASLRTTMVSRLIDLQHDHPFAGEVKMLPSPEALCYVNGRKVMTKTIHDDESIVTVTTITMVMITTTIMYDAEGERAGEFTNGLTSYPWQEPRLQISPSRAGDQSFTETVCWPSLNVSSFHAHL